MFVISVLGRIRTSHYDDSRPMSTTEPSLESTFWQFMTRLGSGGSHATSSKSRTTNLITSSFGSRPRRSASVLHRRHHLAELLGREVNDTLLDGARGLDARDEVRHLAARVRRIATVDEEDPRRHVRRRHLEAVPDLFHHGEDTLASLIVNRCTVVLPYEAMKRAQTKQNQIRMTDDLKARIRKYQDKLHKDTGMEANFSETVRALLDRALKAVGL